jgi:ketosteroid isomerase-like protein
MVDHEEIWRQISEANRTWTTKDPHDIASLFHENVVMVVDGPPGRFHGRDAVVRTYVETRQRLEILEFQELEHSVDMAGGVAVVMYTFRLKYEANGALGEEVGREILVLSGENKHWRVVWRTRLLDQR